MKKEALLILVVIVGLGVGLVFLNSRSQKIPETIINDQVPTLSQNIEASEPGYVESVSSNSASEINLTIDNPANNSTVANPSVAVRGKTTPGAEVFVNDQIGRADASGNFYFQVSLDEGENEILIVANNERGQAAEKSVIVTYSPQE